MSSSLPFMSAFLSNFFRKKSMPFEVVRSVLCTTL